MPFKLTEHFTLDELIRSETAQRLHIHNVPTSEHMKNLQKTAEGLEAVRKLGHGPMVITSGYRCPELNRAVGGTPTSHHALGWAADFYFVKWATRFAAPELATALVGHPDAPLFDQFILELDRGIMHISFHPKGRRQILTQLGGPGSKIIPGIHPNGEPE